MKIINEQMSVKLQDLLLSQGYNPSQFKYVSQTASNMVFRHNKTGKLVDFRY